LDFINGSLGNIEIVGTGSSAKLQLSSNSTAGYWIKKSPITSPSIKSHHGMATLYGTNEVLLFGGYKSENITKVPCDIVLVLDTSGSMYGPMGSKWG